MRGLPIPRLPRVDADAVAIAGGMDVTVSPMFAKPGTARLAYNYEWSVNGGLERLRGIEPFDGRDRPSDADYLYMQCSAAIAGIALADTVTGATSAATGKVIYLSGAFVALTRVTGAFVVEGLQVGGITRATVSDLSPEVSGFLDNTLAKLAADEYQASITQVPGAGQLRGLQILNDVVYAWRNNAGNTAMAIYKQSTSGWTLVPLGNYVTFSAGALGTIVEGNTITDATTGGTAVVTRVVLESGTVWIGGSGKLVLGAITGTIGSGNALQVGGTTRATSTSAGTAITLSPSGRVRAQVYSFTASLATRRLYGCDGVSAEFEFDGTVYVPISTGMGSIRATTVSCHKNQLFFGYRTSLQHSGPGTPYVWSAVLGASELGIGDTITNLLSVGGATDASALIVTSNNSLHMVYGSSSLNWNVVPLSHVSGAKADTAHDIGGVIALDSPGVMRYPATQNFGNFSWDLVSLAIKPLIANQMASCSAYVSGLFRYRLFLTDGTAISGLPVSGKGIYWSVINYGKTIVLAINEEISGVARTFYGDSEGRVYEADVGRSFAGSVIDYAILLHPVTQRSPMVEKLYRQMQVEITAESACTIFTSAEFNGDEGISRQSSADQFGAGLVWDIGNYDQSYWDVSTLGRKTVPLEGIGTSAAISIAGSSNSEMSHTIFAITVLYTPRKLTR